MGAEAAPKKILVVSNKSWEADPLVSVLLNPQLRPEPGFNDWTSGASGLFSTYLGARPAATPPCPRCTYTSAELDIEVWCIEDWMAGVSHSSSKVKVEQVLPAVPRAPAKLRARDNGGGQENKEGGHGIGFTGLILRRMVAAIASSKNSDTLYSEETSK